MRWGTRVYRRALAVLPRWFRERYADEMVDQFERRSASIEAERGRRAAFAFLLRALLDLPEAWNDARHLGGGAFGTRAGGRPWLDDLTQAARSLSRAPGWSGTALVILTLGIGGTTLVFSVLNAVLLRPLPFDEPDRLVSLWTVNTVQSLPDGSSWENATDWLERSASLEDLTLVLRPEFTGATVTTFGEPERIHVGLVSANFFELLGVRPVAGRFFGLDDLDTDTRLAVIDEALWQKRFGVGGIFLDESQQVNLKPPRQEMKQTCRAQWASPRQGVGGLRG